MTRTAGWHLDPSGEPRMRYWDGADWTEETRQISTEDLPPLDFLEEVAAEPPAQVPAPVPVAVAVEPEPEPEPEPVPEKRRRANPLPLVGAVLALLPAGVVFVFPIAVAIRRILGWPFWSGYAIWVLTAGVLLIPPARTALARLAPSRASAKEKSEEPAAPLAVLAWLIGPVTLFGLLFAVLTGGVDRLWSFTKHLAGTGKNRRTTESTPMLLIGLVRALLFWVLWVAVAVLWLVLHGLTAVTDGLRWVATATGDRIRTPGPESAK